MLRSPWRLLSRNPRTTAAGATGVLLLALVVPSGTAPAAALGSASPVDPPASYEAQTTCRSTPQPGTVALARWLQRTYPATGSMGMIRGCHVGGTSEHKDGRAFDWAADVSKPAAKRSAYDFIAKALATDAAGNEHALARRLGIMYIIYNDTMWSSYRDFAPRPYLNSGCKTKKKCSRSLRHLNHVHISLGFSGGAAQTSWYRNRGIASIPVFFPGTKQLDPEDTALTSFTAKADGTVAMSPFYLRAGTTYRIVVTGNVRYSTTAISDANCIGDASGWRTTDRLNLKHTGAWWANSPARSQGWHDGDDGWGGWDGGNGGDDPAHEDSSTALPVLTTHGLLLNGLLRWGEECATDHTYEAWFTPTAKQRLRMKYADLVPLDNSGTFTVYVARDDIARSSLARRK